MREAIHRRRPGSDAIVAAAALLALLLGASFSAPVRAAADDSDFPVEEIVLDNGMKLLLLERPGLPMTAAAWAVRSGSGDEHPGTTGVAHLLEHLLYKGSRTIGSRDPLREGPLLERRDRLESELRAAADDPRRRERLGRQIEQLDAQLRELHFKGEYALLYTEAGVVGINALTREDVTLYYSMVPASRLELWFWLESDRLSEPALRELYDEYGVVEQEREQRVGAVPGALEREEFRSRFWGEGHPYSWSPIGRRQDLRAITRPVALEWLRQHYTADNLVAALIGDFEREQVLDWARRYFGRLPASAAGGERSSGTDAPGESSGTVTPGTSTGTVAPGASTGTDAAEESSGTDAATASPGGAPHQPPPEPVRLERTCDCPTRVDLRYPTVPFGHPDAVVLDVLSGVLSGRTGRLHRGLVLERGIAFSAVSEHAPLRRAGSFTVSLEALEGTEPAALERAWYEELERLRREPVGERELRKVKNQIVTDAARQIEEPLAQALRLLAYEALGDWRHLYRWPELAEAVDAARLQQVVERYLDRERASRLVLVRADAEATSAP